jgi:hypothetical protein
MIMGNLPLISRDADLTKDQGLDLQERKKFVAGKEVVGT